MSVPLHDAGLQRGLREHGAKGLGHALEAAGHADEDLAHAASLEVVDDVGADSKLRLNFESAPTDWLSDL